MKVAIIQFDNRTPAQLGPKIQLIARNRAYAAKHGYAYHGAGRTAVDLPPYWLKPDLCRRALTGGYDAVLWVDSDAVLYDLDSPIETLFAGDEAMVAAGDNPAWSSPFNAGVFLARGRRGAEIMQAWSALFDKARWTKGPDGWSCAEEWAGDAYEQGAFGAHLLGPLAAAGDLRLEDWRRLQSPIPLPQSFTLHFPRLYAMNIPIYVRHLETEALEGA